MDARYNLLNVCVDGRMNFKSLGSKDMKQNQIPKRIPKSPRGRVSTKFSGGSASENLHIEVHVDDWKGVFWMLDSSIQANKIRADAGGRRASCGRESGRSRLGFVGVPHLRFAVVKVASLVHIHERQAFWG